MKTIILAIFILLATVQYGNAALTCDKFNVGDGALFTYWTPVYRQPGYWPSGSLPKGTERIILDGPVIKYTGTRGYCWYKVDEGWVYDLYAKKISSVMWPYVHISDIDPFAGDVLSGNVQFSITADASEDMTIVYVGVDLEYINSVTVDPPSKGGTFFVDLDTTQFPNGWHIITIYVYSNRSSASSSWWAEINN